jgi:hypothetical protein
MLLHACTAEAEAPEPPRDADGFADQFAIHCKTRWENQFKSTFTVHLLNYEDSQRDFRTA